jgi:hypothetical protein
VLKRRDRMSRRPRKRLSRSEDDLRLVFRASDV